MNRSKILGFAVGPIGAAVLGFVSLPASTWMFGAADIGRIAMLQTITGLAIVIVGLGLDQSYLREFHETANRTALFRQVMLPGLALMAAASAGLALIAPGWISHSLFGADSANLDSVVVLVMLTAFCSRFFSLILRMQERGLAFSMSQVLSKLFFLAALLLTYLLLPERTFVQLLAANALAGGAAMLIFAWNTRATWLGRADGAPDAPTLRHMLRYGLPLMVAGLAFWGVEAMDKVALRVLSDFHQLGTYSVAIGIASVAGTLAVLFTTIWIPTAYRWAAEPDCAERIEALAGKLVALGAIVITLTGAFTWTLRFLLPAKFGAVQYLVCLCMVPPILYATAEVTGIGAGIARKNVSVMVSSLLACAVNLAGVCLLVPPLGAAGAGIATALAFFVLFVSRTEASVRHWAPLRRRHLYAPLASATALAIAFALGGARFPTAWLIVWHALAILTLVAHRALLAELLSKLRRNDRRGRGAGVLAATPSITKDEA